MSLDVSWCFSSPPLAVCSSPGAALKMLHCAVQIRCGTSLFWKAKAREECEECGDFLRGKRLKEWSSMVAAREAKGTQRWPHQQIVQWQSMEQLSSSSDSWDLVQDFTRNATDSNQSSISSTCFIPFFRSAKGYIGYQSSEKQYTFPKKNCKKLNDLSWHQLIFDIALESPRSSLWHGFSNCTWMCSSFFKTPRKRDEARTLELAWVGACWCFAVMNPFESAQLEFEDVWSKLTQNPSCCSQFQVWFLQGGVVVVEAAQLPMMSSWHTT